MKYLFFFSLLVILMSCKKTNDAPQGNSTYTVNGTTYTSNSNGIQYNYKSNILSTCNFSIGGISFSMGDVWNMHSFKNIYSTDSIISPVTYNSFNTGHTAPDGIFIPDLSLSTVSYFNFHVTISRVSNGTIDGTFSGKAIGISTSNGGALTDTITNGLFNNVPIIRMYQ